MLSLKHAFQTSSLNVFTFGGFVLTFYRNDPWSSMDLIMFIITGNML